MFALGLMVINNPACEECFYGVLGLYLHRKEQQRYTEERRPYYCRRRLALYDKSTIGDCLYE